MKKVNELLAYAIVLRLTNNSIHAGRVNADRNQESAKSGTKLFV